jgi:hypothetical protein
VSLAIARAAYDTGLTDPEQSLFDLVDNPMSLLARLSLRLTACSPPRAVRSKPLDE